MNTDRRRCDPTWRDTLPVRDDAERVAWVAIELARKDARISELERENRLLRNYISALEGQ